MKVVLVTGGRAYADFVTVVEVLNEECPDLIIHGGARLTVPDAKLGELRHVGADWLTSLWAYEHDVPQLIVPYLRRHGKVGGPIRNTWEVDRLDEYRELGHDCKAIAFPGNTGTADTVKKARGRGHVIREIA